MLKNSHSALRVVGLALGLAITFAGMTFAQTGTKGGGKGGGGTSPVGTVFFRHDGALWRMNPDGSNRTPLPNAPDNNYEPSRQRHAGEYWLLIPEFPDNVNAFPNGAPYFELWAASETGITAAAPLVAAREMEILSFPVWTPDDFHVTFIGERWLLDGTGQPTEVVEAGLYAAAVGYAADGGIAGGVPGSLTLLADLTRELGVDAAGFHQNGQVAGLSWSPDPSKFTFAIRRQADGANIQQIWIVDLAEVSDPHNVPQDALFLLDSGKGVGWPEWSPDGRRISYHTFNGAVVFDLARGRAKVLQRSANDSWGVPKWSPDGSHFVIYHWDNFSGYDAIYRFKADITGKSELTAGLCEDAPAFHCVLIPNGWRE